MNRALSDDDIRPYIKNIISYNELKNISANHLVCLLPVAILYNTAPNYGHWTLLHKVGDGIEFFDSYSYKPDREFEVISDEYQQPPYLLRLLKELREDNVIHYNQYPFQSREPGVNTCGRWIILRKLFGNYNIDKFAKGVSKTAKDIGMSKDELVVATIK